MMTLNEIEQAFTEAGFEQWQTGGGCTSYGKHLPGGYTIQITAGEDSQHPTEDGPCTVGLYHENETHDLYEGAYVQTATITEAIAKAAKAAEIVAEATRMIDNFMHQ